MLGLSISRRPERSYQVFTGNGTFVVPGTAYGKIEVTTVGGGGGGAGSTNYGSGGAGGGGGYVTAWNPLNVTPNASYSITVGNGRWPGNGDGASGYNGGTTSFASLQSSGGGPGGGLGGGSGQVDLGLECQTYTGYRYVSGGGGGYYSPPASARGQGGNGGPDRTANSYLTTYGSGGIAGIVIVRWDG